MTAKPGGRIVPQFICALLAAGMLAHCQMARMHVDPALASVPPLKVERSNWTMSDKPMRFGDWHTTEMTVGWEKTQVKGFFVNHQKSEQPYHFVLATTSGPIAGDCLAAARFDEIGAETQIQIDLAKKNGETKFRCRYSGAAEGTLTLVPELKPSIALLGDFLAGDLDFGGEHWKVTTTSQIEQAPGAPGGAPVGYDIRRDDHVVASVETINGGRVWMSLASSQLDQDRLAAAIASLLMYRALRPMARE